MTEKLGPRLPFAFSQPPTIDYSKRHHSKIERDIGEADFLSQETQGLDDRVKKMSKRINADSPTSGSGSPSDASSSDLGFRVSPVSSNSGSPHNGSDTPPPASKSAFQLPAPDMSAFQLPVPDMTVNKPSAPDMSALTLPDMSGFETTYGAVTKGPQVPKTPGRLVRIDQFRQNIIDMLQDGEILINGEDVRILRALGAGRFSVVHLLSNGDVAKFPNDLDQTPTRKIQNDQRSARMQYNQLCAMGEELATINIGVVTTIFREDGVVIQPFCESFTPTWNENTLMTDLLPREKLILQTAKAAFAYFFRRGTPVDFRPDNMALDPTNPAFLHIRDFYEMDNDDKDRFSDFAWDLLEKWALGNKAIYDYLDPRPKVALPVRT